jgi:hypothetical protein
MSANLDNDRRHRNPGDMHSKESPDSNGENIGILVWEASLYSGTAIVAFSCELARQCIANATN